MKAYKKLYVSWFASLMVLLLVSFLISSFWKTSFPYGIYVEMKDITLPLVLYTFLGGLTVVINTYKIYANWLKKDVTSWKTNYYCLKNNLKIAIAIIFIASITAFIIPSEVFKLFMSIMIPASLIIFSGFITELLMFKYYLKLS